MTEKMLADICFTVGVVAYFATVVAIVWICMRK